MSQQILAQKDLRRYKRKIYGSQSIYLQVMGNFVLQKKNFCIYFAMKFIRPKLKSIIHSIEFSLNAFLQASFQKDEFHYLFSSKQIPNNPLITQGTTKLLPTSFKAIKFNKPIAPTNLITILLNVHSTIINKGIFLLQNHPIHIWQECHIYHNSSKPLMQYIHRHMEHTMACVET